LNGYVPNGISLIGAIQLRKSNPGEYKKRSLKSMARHVGFYARNAKERQYNF
jgi:urocanate hydratase